MIVVECEAIAMERYGAADGKGAAPMDGESGFKRVIFEVNSLIFDEGTQGDAAYLIIDGAVDLRKGVLSDHPQILARRGKGDVIGEMALFDDRPRSAAAVAVKRTQAVAISRQEFDRRIDEMDPVLSGIVMLLVKRLREATDELIVLRKEVT